MKGRSRLLNSDKSTLFSAVFGVPTIDYWVSPEVRLMTTWGLSPKFRALARGGTWMTQQMVVTKKWDRWTWFWNVMKGHDHNDRQELYIYIYSYTVPCYTSYIAIVDAQSRSKCRQIHDSNISNHSHGCGISNLSEIKSFQEKFFPGEHLVVRQALSKLGIDLNVTGGRCRGENPSDALIGQLAWPIIDSWTCGSDWKCNLLSWGYLGLVVAICCN